MSKRNLYKPAPSQTPPRVARSLTQGRLVSTDPRSLMNNVSPSEPKQSSQSLQPTTMPRARRSLEYNSANSATRSEDRPPSYQISPTIIKSPAPVKPSSSLSLSDTEEQTKTHEVETSKGTLIEPTVLTIDASQRSRLNDNEVPIKTSYIKSPVKVVCHSPLRQSSRSMTDNSQYAHAGKIKVPVENVPTINMSHDNIPIPKINESPSSSSPHASEDGSLSTIAGSPVDPRSKAIETVVVREKNNPRSYVSFLDAEDESGTGSDVITLSDLHMRQPKFDDTGVTSVEDI